ncbi:MAG: TatD family hydrolase [Lachnospiraceae bacterium]|nr:TatD family hydrolase [Lachnospiraceae bacterium]
MIFDTHAHYDDSAFKEDREEILSGLKSNGVGFVVDAAARCSSIPNIIKLTEQYDFLYGAAGLHPTELYKMECGEDDSIRGNKDFYAGDKEFEIVKEALKNPKIIAVGEIGLDYHYPDTDKPFQKEWFARQIHLAKEVNYPILVHSRDSAADTLDVIQAESAKDCGGVIHCFSYELEMAKIYLDLGFYIGVGGVLTYKNGRKLRRIVAYMPMDRILLETDCPYLAPEPVRGSRNNSANIKYVAEKIAEIKGLSFEEVVSITEENAKRMYKWN